MDYSRPDRAERLAADHAVGLMRGGARRRFEALLPAHPALRTALRGWHERLLPLTAALPATEPPARVWARIEARLFGAAPSSVAAPEGSGWWRRLVVWRALSGAALAAAVGLGVLLANPAAQAPVVVVLSAAGAAPGTAPPSFVASLSADGRAVATRPLAPATLQAGRSLELWALPASGAPRSLGLISASDASVVQRGRVARDVTGLAVSLEPAGGSPTGAPTGPILYTGRLAL